jgi:DNA-binding Lrp family transcriptional regulator
MEQGVIKGYTVRIADDYERRRIRAHVMLNVVPKQAAATESALRRMTEVNGLCAISGVYDLIAVVTADSTERMNELLDRIGALPGVECTMISIILAAKVERRGAAPIRRDRPPPAGRGGSSPGRGNCRACLR